MGFQLMGSGGSGGGGGAVPVQEDHIFHSDAERDAYFSAHPDELFDGATCIVLKTDDEGQFQIYQSGKWVAHGAVIRGPQGEKGEKGEKGDKGDATGVEGEGRIHVNPSPDDPSKLIVTVDDDLKALRHGESDAVYVTDLDDSKSEINFSANSPAEKDIKASIKEALTANIAFQESISGEVHRYISIPNNKGRVGEEALQIEIKSTTTKGAGTIDEQDGYTYNTIMRYVNATPNLKTNSIYRASLTAKSRVIYVGMGDTLSAGDGTESYAIVEHTNDLGFEDRYHAKSLEYGERAYHAILPSDFDEVRLLESNEESEVIDDESIMASGDRHDRNRIPCLDTGGRRYESTVGWDTILRHAVSEAPNKTYQLLNTSSVISKNDLTSGTYHFDNVKQNDGEVLMNLTDVVFDEDTGKGTAKLAIKCTAGNVKLLLPSESRPNGAVLGYDRGGSETTKQEIEFERPSPTGYFEITSISSSFSGIKHALPRITEIGSRLHQSRLPLSLSTNRIDIGDEDEYRNAPIVPVSDTIDDLTNTLLSVVDVYLTFDAYKASSSTWIKNKSINDFETNYNINTPVLVYQDDIDVWVIYFPIFSFAREFEENAYRSESNIDGSRIFLAEKDRIGSERQDFFAKQFVNFKGIFTHTVDGPQLPDVTEADNGAWCATYSTMYKFVTAVWRVKSGKWVIERDNDRVVDIKVTGSKLTHVFRSGEEKTVEIGGGPDASTIDVVHFWHINKKTTAAEVSAAHAQEQADDFISHTDDLLPTSLKETTFTARRPEDGGKGIADFEYFSIAFKKDFFTDDDGNISEPTLVDTGSGYSPDYDQYTLNIDGIEMMVLTSPERNQTASINALKLGQEGDLTRKPKKGN